jgi:pimeloyl-ACP methyl ester carboxylesterase
MPFLKIGQENIPLYYELTGIAEHGKGTLVFVNGWTQSQRYWREAVIRLSHRYRILTYDMRGFGQSQNPGSSSPPEFKGSIADATGELIELINKLKLDGEPLHVVGHSLGAVVAARFAAITEQAGNLASLTIINSGSFGPTDKSGNILIPFVKVIVALKRFSGLPGIRSQVVGRFFAKPIGAQYERTLVEDLIQADRRISLEISISSLEKGNLDQYREDLKNLNAPLLLIVGDKDKSIPPKGMYNIKSFKKEAELVPFQECGHLPMLEEPDRFCQILDRFYAVKPVQVT